MRLVEIYETYHDENVSADEFFEILEANHMHPGDIEELLGNETTRQYEQWVYFNLK